ncbi:MAG TPA: amidase [Saprospiraceae bacterium]|nr:amidase [Saprospiraceae bacterium]
MSLPRALFCFLVILSVWSCRSSQPAATNQLTPREVEAAQRLFGLGLSPSEIDTLLPSLQSNLATYHAQRQQPLSNSVFPALYFDPHPRGFQIPTSQQVQDWGLPSSVVLPKNREELAFYPIAELAVLIRQQRISSLELTQLYLDRLKRFDDQLQCVVTLTEELALEQARRADAELVAGRYRGPLHGIPYGLKDLVSVPGYPTTWGAGPYRDQQIDTLATVAQKLEAAGAVLIAKLTSGELAYGDVWFGGRTVNPWDVSQGARGSSAGSAAATAAGLVGFSLGTETWGSIVSPATRCGATGLRPTYGRVSRHGVMALSWSLDKVGPIGRTAQDCALIFEAIRGTDGQDRTVVEAAFNFRAQRPPNQWRVGYLEEAFARDSSTRGEANRSALATFREMGLEPQPIELPDQLPWNGVISTIIRGESAAAFDQLVLQNQDDELARQTRSSRANSLRQSRFIPAAEYLQANRHRSLLIEDMAKLFKNYDVLILPTYGSDQSAISNMTGHPVISLPIGFDEQGRPLSIILMGQLYAEASILEVAHQFQLRTDHEGNPPPLFKP